MNRDRIELTEARLRRTVMTDELLDHLAERFIAGRVRELVGVRFDQYLALGPGRLDELAERMRRGVAALQRTGDAAHFSVIGMPCGRDGLAVIAAPGSVN